MLGRRTYNISFSCKIIRRYTISCTAAMLFYNNFPLGIIIVPNYLADAGNIYMSRQGIFNADYRGSYHSLHLGLFKAKVGICHLAVNKP